MWNLAMAHQPSLRSLVVANSDAPPYFVNEDGSLEEIEV